MNDVSRRRSSLFLVGVAVALSALAVWGLARRSGQGWEGFRCHAPRWNVVSVEPGGAAEAAGMRVGDRVLSVDGRAVEGLRMPSRWATPRVGETHRFLVEREGRQVTADVVYRRWRANPFLIGANVVLLSFLWCGVWASLAVRTAPARILTAIGLAGGAGAAATPSFGGVWNGVASHVQLASLLLLIILLLRFFLVFPSPKRVSRSRLAAGAMYGVLGLLVAAQAAELVAHPRLYGLPGNLDAIAMLIFLLLTLAAVVHSVATAPRGELWPSGMGWALLGFAAIPVAVVGSLVMAALRVPGGGLVELLFLVPPFALAAAVAKNARREEAAAVGTSQPA